MDNKKKDNAAVNNFINEVSYFHNMFKDGFNELEGVIPSLSETTPKEYSELGIYRSVTGEVVLRRITPGDGVPEVTLTFHSGGATTIGVLPVEDGEAAFVRFTPADTRKAKFYTDAVKEIAKSGQNVEEVFRTLISMLYDAVGAMTEARRINNSRKFKGADSLTAVRQWADSAASMRYELEGVLKALRNDTLHNGEFRKELGVHGAAWLGLFRTAQISATMSDGKVDYHLNAFSNGDISLAIRSRESNRGLTQLFVVPLDIIRQEGEAERIVDALCNSEVPFGKLMEKMHTLLHNLIDNANAVADALAASRRVQSKG